VIDVDAMDEETRLRKTVGRLATYLQGYGDTLVDANGWDPALLAKFKEDPRVAGFSGAFDAVGTTEDLEYLAEKAIPEEWLAAHITGTARNCAEQVRDQFGMTGVDSIIMHGVNPDQLAGVLTEYDDVRSSVLPTLPANPGWMA
jgi:5,10-methylenetetrahydromethanopterin reductase